MSEEPRQATGAEPQTELDSAKIALVVERIRSEQNLALGTVAGLFGALVGAVVWAVITVFTEFQIGWMAVGVGFLVGIAIRTLGKGIDQIFGFVGAGLALTGCLLGNVLTVCGIIAKQEDMAFLDVFSRLDLGVMTELLVATFSPMDILFYSIAVYEGYRLSFRKVSPDELLNV